MMNVMFSKTFPYFVPVNTRILDLSAAFDQRFAVELARPVTRTHNVLRELGRPSDVTLVKWGQRQDEAREAAAWLICEVLQELSRREVCVNGHDISNMNPVGPCWKCRKNEKQRGKKP